MDKSPDAFRTITEVAEWLDTPAHVLRFWESRFPQIKPVKRAGGRRYYRPIDMLLLGGIKKLLHEDGITIKGVQNLLREKGIKHVQSLSLPLGLTVTIKKKPAVKAKAAPTPQAAPVEPHIEPTIDPMALQEPVSVPQAKQEPLILSDTIEVPSTAAKSPAKKSQDAPFIASAEEAHLVIASLPEKLKSAHELSTKDIQDIEALYYSLKMVRNNMRRTGAGR